MREVKLWKNKYELSDLVALVDDEDYDKVAEALLRYNKDGKLRKDSGKWYAHAPTTCSATYAMSGCRRLSIHRVVMDAPAGMDVDHIDGNGLNNCKENLRVCTRQQNSMNKSVRSDSASGYKGVYEIKKPNRTKYVSKKTGETKYYEHMPKKRFVAYIGDPDKPSRGNIKLGYYSTLEEAARARDRKAIELHGEFASLNFPDRLTKYMSEIKYLERDND